MVGFIDIHSLTLAELSGVVNLYPWYGAARLELCRRMARMEDWGEEEYAAQALYIQDRGKLSSLVRIQADCSDKDVRKLLASYMETSAPENQVHVVGGDYFSQAQYDKVKQSGDPVFSRFAGKARSGDEGEGDDGSGIAERFATETLAKIFAEQGRTTEARSIYSRLILDIPEKSAYFASLIENLE